MVYSCSVSSMLITATFTRRQSEGTTFTGALSERASLRVILERRREQEIQGQRQRSTSSGYALSVR